jgi:hypothetical protein
MLLKGKEKGAWTRGRERSTVHGAHMIRDQAPGARCWGLGAATKSCPPAAFCLLPTAFCLLPFIPGQATFPRPPRIQRYESIG